MAEKLASLKKKGISGNKGVFVHYGTLSSANIVCGFKPDYIVIADSAWATSYKLNLWYDSSISTTYYQQVLNTSYSTVTINSSGLITSIGNDGFALKAAEIGNASAGALIIAVKKDLL